MQTKIKTFIKSRTFLVAGATMLGLAAASPAVQADAFDAPSIHVNYGDLNIESDMGARVLYTRIRNAAREVCSPLDGGDLARRSSYQGCVSTAITSSVATVNNARVTAMMHNETVKTSRKS